MKLGNWVRRAFALNRLWLQIIPACGLRRQRRVNVPESPIGTYPAPSYDCPYTSYRSRFSASYVNIILKFIAYIKCVIMSKEDDNYVVGIYFIDKEFGDVSDGDLLVRKINYLVKNNMESGEISHLSRSLRITSLFKDEEYILKHIASCCEDEDDEDEDEIDEFDIDEDEDEEIINDETSEEEDEITLAAMDAVTECDSDEEIDQDDQFPTDDQEMDSSVVSIGNNFQDEQHEFMFTPIRKIRKNKPDE